MPVRTLPQTRRPPYLAALAAGCALAVVLSGCQMRSRSAEVHTGSIEASQVLKASDLNQQEAIAAVQTWGKAYAGDERNKLAALNFAAALRAAGESGQAVAVMRKAAIYHPEDRDVLAAYGKALAEAGQFKEALTKIRQAQRDDNPDWQLLSAEGGVLDSLGQHQEARKAYRQALVLAPDQPQILNNLGMSYVLTGELDQAEATLRKALGRDGATARTRQNLALVLGLKGDFKAAEVMATKDLSPEEAKANMAVLRNMLSQRDTWKEIEASG